MGTQLPAPQKGAQRPPIFGPCLLWPNNWMDQDATWYDGRPRPGQHCFRCRPSSNPEGAQPPNFSPCLLWPNGWMDQDATWYEGRPQPRPHCVTWGPSSPPPKKGAQPPNFWPTSIVAKRSLISATAEHLFNLSGAGLLRLSWKNRPLNWCLSAFHALTLMVR